MPRQEIERLPLGRAFRDGQDCREEPTGTFRPSNVERQAARRTAIEIAKVTGTCRPDQFAGYYLTVENITGVYRGKVISRRAR
jgi:hypothetical protein